MWNLKAIPPGAYQLDVWIPLDPHADHATNVAYLVRHVQGDTSVEVDLTGTVFRWLSLGEFTFDKNSRVEVSNQADRFVVVEGIRLRKAQS